MSSVFNSPVSYFLIIFLANFSKAEPLVGRSVRQASKHEFSFIVSIGIKQKYGPKRKHLCTGSLISKEHVLTAAHCFESGRPIIHFEVHVGSPDITACNRYYIRSILTYDEWAKRKKKISKFEQNDIAIVTLNREVTELNVSPAIFSAKKNKQLFGLDVQTAGWGDSGNNRNPDLLQTVSLKILTKNGCEEILSHQRGKIMQINDIWLCTKADPYALLACGDSGGPLFYKDNKIIGINTGVSCDESVDNPLNIHIGIDYYKDFIDDVISIAYNQA